jgi:magnesium chelatase family protein
MAVAQNRPMLASLESAAVVGIHASPVQIEVDLCFGLPLSAVGTDTSVKGNRHVHAAIRNSGFEFRSCIVIGARRRAAARRSTCPSRSAHHASGGASRDIATSSSGELSLDGAMPARVLPIAVAARQQGAAAVLLPAANEAEASVVEGLRLLPVRTLGEAVTLLNRPRDEWPVSPPPQPPPVSAPDGDLDLSDLRGQGFARRALEVAAAGGHNLLMIGPPGAGKTMLARRLPTVLPPLGFDEALEATAIHSVAGLIPPGGGLLTDRPFRAPHHTISDAALVGGGSQPRPGEVSLAHHGVLFLDEMPEFERRVLDSLRQPGEEGRISVSRAARSVVFTARFMLVAAGPYRADLGAHAACRYIAMRSIATARVSRLCATLDQSSKSTRPVGALGSGPRGEPSAEVRRRVLEARERQARRQPMLNARLPARSLQRACALGPGGRSLLDRSAERLALSARAYHRVLRVARTIADLEGAAHIAEAHLAEALQYRFVE